jgi:type II secretory pathway pseudopilin PulG
VNAEASARLKDERGIATSLLEAVLVIAIVAIVSAIALTAAMNHIENARLARAASDTEAIAISIHSFMHDTGFAPAFKNGNARGPGDDIFLVLETGGSDPFIDPMAGMSLHWPMHAADHDLLENQLVKNKPGNTGTAYPRMGEISFARFKGWNGPYTASMPSSDPWGDKYLVNVQLLTPKGVQMAHDTLTLGTGQRAAAFVISAGPNRQLDTKFDQAADSFVAGGDDVVYRIQ